MEKLLLPILCSLITYLLMEVTEGRTNSRSSIAVAVSFTRLASIDTYRIPEALQSLGLIERSPTPEPDSNTMLARAEEMNRQLLVGFLHHL